MPKPTKPRGGRERDEMLPRNHAASNPFIQNGAPIEGVCCVCGCEEDNPCEEGCEWVNAERTLCSACLTQIGPIRPAMIKAYCGGGAWLRRGKG